MKPDSNLPKLNNCVYERRVDINVEKVAGNEEHQKIIHAHFVDDLHDLELKLFLDNDEVESSKSFIHFARAPFKVCLATENLIKACHGQTIQELLEKKSLNSKDTKTNKRLGCFRQDEILQLIWSMLVQKLDSFQLSENAKQGKWFPQNKDIAVQVGLDILHIKLKTQEKINTVTKLVKVQVQGQDLLKKIPTKEKAQATNLMSTRQVLKHTSSLNSQEKESVQYLINLIRTNMLRFQVGLNKIRQQLSLPLEHPDKPNKPSGDFEVYRKMIDCHAFNLGDTTKNLE